MNLTRILADAHAQSADTRARMSSAYEKAASPQKTTIRLIYCSAPSVDSDVIVTGTFDDWSQSVVMTVTQKDELEAALKSMDELSLSLASLAPDEEAIIHTAEVEIMMTPGEKIFYKFIVDDVWQYDPSQPIAFDSDFNLNNIIVAPMPSSDSAINLLEITESEFYSELMQQTDDAAALEPIEDAPYELEQPQSEEVLSPGIDEVPMDPANQDEGAQSNSLMMKVLGMALGGGWGGNGQRQKQQEEEVDIVEPVKPIEEVVEVSQIIDDMFVPSETEVEPAPEVFEETAVEEVVSSEVEPALDLEKETTPFVETVAATDPVVQEDTVDSAVAIKPTVSEAVEGAVEAVVEKLVPYIIEEKQGGVIKGVMPMPEMTMDTKALTEEKEGSRIFYARVGHGHLTFRLEKP